MRRLTLAALAAVFLVGAHAASAPAPAPHSVSFGGPEGVIELKQTLDSYRPPNVAKFAASDWYTFTAVNQSNRAAIRVLLAGQPPDIGLGVLPHATRRPSGKW